MDVDPETLWQLVELKHKVHLSSKVEAVMKLAARKLSWLRSGKEHLSQSFPLNNITTMHLRHIMTRRIL
jgi:hypothetical protein